MAEQIPVAGDKVAVVAKKNELENVKTKINAFSQKTETGITDLIENNFTNLSTQDKAILKEMALSARALSKAIKYIWSIMK